MSLLLEKCKRHLHALADGLAADCERERQAKAQWPKEAAEAEVLASVDARQAEAIR